MFKTYYFGQKGRAPHLLITAGVHGDEFEPMAAVMQLIKKLKQIPLEKIKGKITLVPVVNEEAYFNASRTASDGLDLARVCPGNEKGSITEKVAANLSGLIREAEFFIDLHNGGRLFQIAPFSGYMIHKSPEILNWQRIMAKAFNLPVIWGTTDKLEGRSLSVARDANIPAIYVENGGGFFNKNLIETFVDGCLNVMKALDILDVELEIREYPDEIISVEDPSEESGHLQKMLPASADGFFISNVVPGEKVKKGQLWGTISRLDNDQEIPVKADKEGMALFVRAVPAVKKEDSLGGIISYKEEDLL